MINALIICGIILSINQIKRNKVLGVGFLMFLLLEFLFRDFGLYGIPIVSSSVSKFIFMLSTVLLCILCKLVISYREDDK